DDRSAWLEPDLANGDRTGLLVDLLCQHDVEAPGGQVALRRDRPRAVLRHRRGGTYVGTDPQLDRGAGLAGAGEGRPLGRGGVARAGPGGIQAGHGGDGERTGHRVAGGGGVAGYGGVRGGGLEAV